MITDAGMHMIAQAIGSAGKAIGEGMKALAESREQQAREARTANLLRYANEWTGDGSNGALGMAERALGLRDE